MAEVSGGTLEIKDRRLAELGGQVAALESQVARMAAEQDRRQGELAAAQAEKAALTADLVAHREAFERVGEAAGYRLPKHAEETWGDYKRRVLEVFEAGRDSPVAKAILDLLSFREREEYRANLAAKTPEQAELHRQAALAAKAARVSITQALYFRDLRWRREEELREAKEYANLALDDSRLATPSGRY